METLYEIFCFTLFVLEGFLAVSYFHIAFSLRALPLKDMARMNYFFLFGVLTIATTSQAVASKFWIVDTFLMAHHLFCYVTWNSSSYTKKIIHWSSLNWTTSRVKAIPLFLGSLGVMLLHLEHTYTLGMELDIRLVILGLVGTHCAVMAVMYNSQLAWAAPSSIPAWIAKRVEDSEKILSPPEEDEDDAVDNSYRRRSRKSKKSH